MEPTQEELAEATLRFSKELVNRKEVLKLIEEHDANCLETIKHFSSAHQTIIGNRITDAFSELKKDIKKLKIENQ